jgi:tripartite ATP-independent transporter DctM subunit
MSPMIVGSIGIIIMLVLLVLGMPIGYGMALVGFFGVWYFTSIPAVINIAATVPYDAMANYGLCVLPLFLLFGAVCKNSEMGRDLFNMAYKWMGRVPGALALACLVEGTIFGAISSSGIATIIVVGKVSLPEMTKGKYDDALATGCVAIGGILGILLPPSSIMVIYGIMTEQSIAAVFIAGIIPGMILAFMFMAYAIIVCIKNPKMGPPGPSFTLKEKIWSLGPSLEINLLTVLVLVGLVVGWFTPTESGAIAAAGAIVFSLFKRRLSWKGFKESLWETIGGSGMIYVMLIGSFIFNSFMAMSQIPMNIADIVAGLHLPPLVIVIIIIAIYFVLGTFFDEMAMILLTLPVFFPIILKIGYDPIWFGIVVTWAVGMGQITPPVGMGIYVTAGLAKDVPLTTILRGLIPFIIMELIFAALLIAFPQMATWLPSLMH